MHARSFRLRRLIALASLTLAGCAPATTSMSQRSVGPARIPSLTPTSRVLDAERIRRSGARTAWDAVRLLVPSYRFQSNRGPSLRGGSAEVPPFDSPVRLEIDGHRIRDLSALQAIPVDELVAIHVLSATEAATYFGADGGDGAIVVRTRHSLVSR